MSDMGLVNTVLDPPPPLPAASVSSELKHQVEERRGEGRHRPDRLAYRSTNNPVPDPVHISGHLVIGASRNRHLGPRTACRCCSADSSSAASSGTRTDLRGIASRQSSGCRGRYGRESGRERTETGKLRARPRGGDSGSGYGGEELAERQWEPQAAAAERRGRQRGPFWRFRGK